MPTNKKGYMKRYYNRNKQKFNNAVERTKRAKRNQARRIMIKKHGKAALRGKDIDHIKPLKSGGSNKIKNLRIRTPRFNRGRK